MPVVFVQLKAGAQAEPDELHEFARAHISERAATPAEVVIVPTMPLTAVGKVFKPQLRYQAAQLAFERLARSVLGPAANVVVEVGPHPEHGTVATIKTDGAGSEALARLRTALMPFQMHHEIVGS